MASVDKQSLRQEFDALKGRFGQLAADGKLSAESRALIEALLMLLQLLMAVFMERNTTKTSANSSKPSSRNDKDETSVSQPGTHGKGKTERKDQCANIRTIETVEISRLASCETCGEDLRKVHPQGYQRRTRIDIIFEKVVTHVDAEIKICPQCAQQGHAAFPEAFSGPVQYGAGIQAYVLNLLIAQMVSLQRVQQMIHTLIGMAISQATVLKYVLQLHHALDRWESAAIEQLLAAPVLHVDETSLRVDKKNQWIHVCSAGDTTLKFLHPRRGLEAITDIGIIPRYGGTIIHDCWASYLSYDHCGHGLCGAHLIRELTFVIDANGYAWAKNMKKLLQQTCRKVARRKRKALTAREYSNLQKQYRNIITRGARELPSIPQRQEGKRGRLAKSDAHNLWERLKKHEAAVLLFAKEPLIPFTNNRAERDLRMAKVKQKVSGCFRNPDFAAAYCRISSYLQTMTNNGYNPLIAIQMALSGQLYDELGE